MIYFDFIVLLKSTTASYWNECSKNLIFSILSSSKLWNIVNKTLWTRESESLLRSRLINDSLPFCSSDISCICWKIKYSWSCQIFINFSYLQYVFSLFLPQYWTDLKPWIFLYQVRRWEPSLIFFTCASSSGVQNLGRNLSKGTVTDGWGVRPTLRE